MNEYLNEYFAISFSPPPNVSSAQKAYDQERFRVQPGRIEDYSLGRGTLAQREAQQVLVNQK